MKISINPHLVGKVDKEVVARVEREQLWEAIDVSPEDAFELITVDGFASTCELRSGRRGANNMSSKQLFMIDIDGGMDLAELMADDFYNNYGLGFYATASFTPQVHKFRILFMTPVPVMDAETAEQLLIGLRQVYPRSDAACIDPARLFYGNPRCDIREWRGSTLPFGIVDQLVEIGKLETQHKHSVKTVEGDSAPLTVEQTGEILDTLKRYYPQLEYHVRRDVTWAVCSAVGGEAAVGLMRSRWLDHDKTYKYEQFVNDHNRNGITIGTVYHMIRQHEPLYRKSMRKMSMDELRELAKEKTRRVENAV